MFFKKKYKYVFAVIPLMILFRPFLFFGCSFGSFLRFWEK